MFIQLFANVSIHLLSPVNCYISPYLYIDLKLAKLDFFFLAATVELFEPTFAP